MRRWTFGLALLVLACGTFAASAAPRQLRVPLREGYLHLDELAEGVVQKLHLPAVDLPAGRIRLSGIGRWVVLQALNRSLGEGCSIHFTDEELIVRMDAAKLPRDVDSAKAATRIFTATAAPDATARQARFHGLLLPHSIDPARPLVVLVHGLDCNRSHWSRLAELFEGDGLQVAYFTYPSDQPIADSARFLGEHLAALHEMHPEMPLDVVAHSMGGIVARGYIEGPDYDGGVEHLILLAPPNQGSNWAHFRFILELHEHYSLWRREPGWGPTWIITDGLGEAGRDLTPDSKYLAELNARPRRAGVKYTIIAGARHPTYRAGADAVDAIAGWVPARAADWWGVRHIHGGLSFSAGKLRTRARGSDGPVALESTKLAGVEDHVTLPADHRSLYDAGEAEPLAWPAIRQRLAR